MTPDNGRFHSLCLRAPWAVFGLVPVVILAAAYLAASLILLSGWKIFFPGSNTPFHPIHGVAIAYFGIGRCLYYFAPTMIGAGMAILAVRYRLKAAWPAIGLVAIALLGGMANIHAGLSTPGRAEQVYFTLQHSGQQIASGLSSALTILAFTLVPYLLWLLAKRFYPGHGAPTQTS